MSVIGLKLLNQAIQDKKLVIPADILQYIDLALWGGHWYTDIEHENCAIPSTFAVFALMLESLKYEELFYKYLEQTHSHQCLQNFLPSAILATHGVNDKSITVYLNLILALTAREYQVQEDFVRHFMSVDHLNTLLNQRKNYSDADWDDLFMNIIGYGRYMDSDYEECAERRFGSREIQCLVQEGFKNTRL